MITFKEDTHQYFDESGKELISVSRVLREAGITPEFKGPDAEYYMLRGKYVHEAICIDVKGQLNEDTVSPEISPRLAGWRRFVAETGFVPYPEFAESIVHSADLGVCGTVDIVGKLPGQENVTIIDVKNGAAASWHRLQLAGYAVCMDAAAGRMNVYLDGNGRYKTAIHSDYSDLDVFRAAAVVARWKIYQ